MAKTCSRSFSLILGNLLDALDHFLVESSSLFTQKTGQKVAQWFTGVDPLADQAPGWTPYRYGFDNPVLFIDPDGLFEVDPWYRNNETGEFQFFEEDQATLSIGGDTWTNYGDGFSTVSGTGLQTNYNADKSFDHHSSSENTLPEVVVSSSRETVPSRNPSNGGWVKSLWDSHLVKALTGDAIGISTDVNLFVFGGSSGKPAGGIFILHGPEAFTLHGYSDIGIGLGVEYSGGISIDRDRVLSWNPRNIGPELFGGPRVSGSLDVGLGVIGGLNGSVSIPGKGVPMVISTGASVGLGATSPFGIGGNVNVGWTEIWKK